MEEELYIDFTPEKVEELKRLYEECEGESFKFEGHEILKDYAKYLIQYLEMQFKIS